MNNIIKGLCLILLIGLFVFVYKSKSTVQAMTRTEYNKATSFEEALDKSIQEMKDLAKHQEFDDKLIANYDALILYVGEAYLSPSLADEKMKEVYNIYVAQLNSYYSKVTNRSSWWNANDIKELQNDIANLKSMNLRSSQQKLVQGSELRELNTKLALLNKYELAKKWIYYTKYHNLENSKEKIAKVNGFLNNSALMVCQPLKQGLEAFSSNLLERHFKSLKRSYEAADDYNSSENEQLKEKIQELIDQSYNVYGSTKYNSELRNMLSKLNNRSKTDQDSYQVAPTSQSNTSYNYSGSSIAKRFSSIESSYKALYNHYNRYSSYDDYIKRIERLKSQMSNLYDECSGDKYSEYREELVEMYTKLSSSTYLAQVRSYFNVKNYNN